MDRVAAAAPRASQPAAPGGAFQRLLSSVRFKSGPLYIEQITTFDGSHHLYAAVDRAAFCLRSPAARRDAVGAVYRPMEVTLRRAGVDDLDFVVVGTGGGAPSLAARLARGRHVTLRRGGRGC